MTETTQIKVWDPLVRFFHWALVSAFVIAYISGDDFLTVHSWAGYLILALLFIRFIWGFIGTRYARFSDFFYRPDEVIQFLKDTMRLRARRYLGHNRRVCHGFSADAQSVNGDSKRGVTAWR